MAATALLVAPQLGHFDDTDAQLYQVVTRHLVEDHRWLDLRYLQAFQPHFRDHLPFGFWPMAAATALFGEPARIAVPLLCSLLTLLLVRALGRRLLGEWPALAAVLVLAATDTFFRYGAASRLDPLLVLLANLAAAPLLLGRTGPGGLALASALAALGALVKGPFGLVPLAAAVLARALEDRSPRLLLRGGAALVAALLPLAAFLLYHRDRLHAGYWDGYLHGQLLGSASGARTDGNLDPWFPFVSLAGRFWPGLPLVLLALVGLLRARRRGPLLLLTVHCLAMVAALCLPARKVWNHELVAYPALALLAGAACLPVGEVLSRYAGRIAAALAALAAAVLVALPVIGRAVDGPPCVAASDFAAALDPLPPGAPILVVSQPTAWPLVASLAAERRLEPVLVPQLPEAGAASLALVKEELAPVHLPAAWQETGRVRGWVLLQRR